MAGKPSENLILKFLFDYSTPLSAAVLVVLLAVGLYLRLVPAKVYGLNYVNGNDPWIAYWLATYFHKYGFYLAGLKDVKSWWYPWGRDFLTSEYLGLSLVASSLASALHVKVVEALGLEPVLFAALGIVGTYLATLYITKSRLGAIVTASVYTLYPVIILDKDFATYPGKQVTGLAIVSWSLFLLGIAYYAKSRVSAFIAALAAGLVGGAVAWFWGGYQYLTVVLAVIMLVEPFLVKPSTDRLLRYAGYIIGYAAILVSSPAVGIRYFAHDLGLGLLGLLVIYALEANLPKLRLDRIHLTREFSWKVHLWVVLLIVGLLVAAITSGIVSLPSRVLLALGVTPLTGVVPLTVAEYESMPFSQIMVEYGPAVFVAAIGFIALLYDLHRRKGSLGQVDVMKLSLFILAFLFIYANVNEAYFAPSAAFFTAMAAGVAVGTFTSMRTSHYDKKLRRIVHKVNYSALAAGALLAIVVLGFAAYYAPQDYVTLKLDAPAVTTGWLTALSVPTPTGGSKVIVPRNSAWLDALGYIRNDTPPSSVVLSWWDYGYWIGALGNRTTVVDGSTLNGTQIELVANALTAPINQSGAYLYMLRLPPNNTYLLTYEIFVGIYNNQTGGVILMPYPNVVAIGSGVYAITYGLGDIAKSYQMLRIAHRVNPYSGSPFFSNYTSVYVSYNNYEFYQFPAFVGGPQQNVTITLHTTIYDLMLYGISVLKQYGYWGTGAKWLDNATSFAPAAVSYVDPTTGSLMPQVVRPPSPEPYFIPVKVFVSVPYAWSPVGSNITYFYSVVVFLYKWTGLP